MDINKKNRSDLKSYFVKNSIPTESNFAELIDGMLNQKDDGIVKLSGDPLSIEAAGDLAGLQKVINFYAKFQDANPAWSLQLNPRTDPNAPATAKAGFCVADGSGAARLFIDRNTGNIGVGVVNPNGKLDVAGQIRMGFDEGGSGIRTISFARDAGDEGNAGKIAYRGGFGADFLHVVGAGAGLRKIKLWDNVIVSGALTPSAGNSENNGIMFPKDPGGGGGDAAWLRYYARAGESCTLELGTSNDADDHIALMPSGGVGIGTNTPGAKLDILANTTTWGGWYEAIRLSQSAHSAITHPGGGLLFGLHGNRRFYFSDTTEGQHAMVINVNPAGGGQVSIGAGDSPIAKLDIAQAARSGTHPTAIDGLYITGDFGEADGVEFRHSNATQGIGFGYNTIYASGSNANQDLQLKPKGTGDVRILGDVIVTGNTALNGNVNLGGFTGADADEWPKLTWYRDTPNNWDEGLIKHASSRGFFGRTGFGIHVHASRDWTFFSTGWDPLFGIEGGTGNTKIKGNVTANGQVYAGNSDIYFSKTDHNHSGIGNAPGMAAIENATNYNCLMILGRTMGKPGAALDRRVELWDSLKVNGSFVNNSDRNAKKDIEDLHYGLAAVRKLRPVSFNWKEIYNPHKSLGLIAQEVQEVITEVIYEDDSDARKGALGVSYINLIPVLINAIKELDAKINR